MKYGVFYHHYYYCSIAPTLSLKAVLPEDADEGQVTVDFPHVQHVVGVQLDDG